MKGHFVLLIISMSLHAQQHEERNIGDKVSNFDRQTWKRIKDHSEIKKNELVAAYSAQYKEWLYAEVIAVPGDNFSGLACFVKDGLFYNYQAIDFKSNVRKLLTDEEFARQKESHSANGCEAQ